MMLEIMPLDDIMKEKSVNVEELWPKYRSLGAKMNCLRDSTAYTNPLRSV